MPQDGTFVFNSKQGAVSQQPAAAPVPMPLDPKAQMASQSSPTVNTSDPGVNPFPDDPTQALPNISSYSTHSLNPQASAKNVAVQSVNDTSFIPAAPAPAPAPTIAPIPVNGDLNLGTLPISQTPVPVPAAPVTESTQSEVAQPDFRALAEEIVVENNAPSISPAAPAAVISPVSAAIPVVTGDDTLQSESPEIQLPQTQASEVSMASVPNPIDIIPPEPLPPAPKPIIAPDPTALNNSVKPQNPIPTPPMSNSAPTPAVAVTVPSTLPEPQLESDPFIQEVHEQDVKVEQEALETLIASNRIDPEIKEHLKIELLKYKDMESDIAPLGQDINTLAAEVMAPEPATPITNPVQAIPPQPPM